MSKYSRLGLVVMLTQIVFLQLIVFVQLWTNPVGEYGSVLPIFALIVFVLGAILFIFA